MTRSRTLLLTDVVDSTHLSDTLGDARIARLWADHDRAARDLLRAHHGREIDKSDGFLLLFERPEQALAFACAYHEALARLDPPLLARAGVHVGDVILIENTAEDVALGAKPVEVEGIAKPTAARVMRLACGGQTLLTRAAVDAMGAMGARPSWSLSPQGHWRLKGLSEPVELFALEAAGVTSPLQSNDKGRRVALRDGIWVEVASDGEAGASPARLRVMIVDDEPRARARLRRLLAPHEVDVVAEAGTGTEALQRVVEARVDLLFLDIEMPGPSGMDVAEQLQSLLPDEVRPLVVFTTAYSEHAVEAFHVGGTDYLLKPVERDRLAEAMGRVHRAVHAR